MVRCYIPLMTQTATDNPKLSGLPNVSFIPTANIRALG